MSDSAQNKISFIYLKIMILDYVRYYLINKPIIPIT
jgi:hypothetical protein